MSVLYATRMEDLEALVLRIVQGEAALWPALQARIQPTIVSIARGHRGMRQRGLAAREDDVADVVAASLERLAKDDFKNLRRFSSARAANSTTFDSWLYGAVEYEVREHIRRRYGKAPTELEDKQRVQPSRRDLQSYAGRIDDAHGSDRALLQTLQMTAKLTASEIFAFARDTFSEQEVRALQLYYVQELGFAELATALSLDEPADADRLIRKLNARLRARFAVAADPPEDKASS